MSALSGAVGLGEAELRDDKDVLAELPLPSMLLEARPLRGVGGP